MLGRPRGLSGRVARRVREAIGDTPLIVKIGHLLEVHIMEQLVRELSPAVQAIAMTNSIATRVSNASGRAMFDGQLRGICGAATRLASLDQVRQFAELIAAQGLAMEIVGVGGIGELSHVHEYLQAGSRSRG